VEPAQARTFDVCSVFHKYHMRTFWSKMPGLPFEEGAEKKILSTADISTACRERIADRTALWKQSVSLERAAHDAVLRWHTAGCQNGSALVSQSPTFACDQNSEILYSRHARALRLNPIPMLM